MLHAEVQRISLADLLRVQARVILALMLRGIRTRFFGNGLGFLFISVIWPLVHMLILVTLYKVTGREVPFGNSAVLFSATGVLPYVVFNYISRWTMLGVLYDKPLAAFPVVKILDLVLARVLLETLGSCLAAISLLVLLWACGVDFMPRDVVQAAFAFGACVLFGIGMGIVNAVIAMAFPAWFTGYVLILILTYAGSGILFVPDFLPETLRYYLGFNPLLQGVEWMRSAYYDGYGSIMLDRSYLLSWGIGTIFVGFGLERLIRGRVLGG